MVLDSITRLDLPGLGTINIVLIFILSRSSFSYAHVNDIGHLEIRAYSARGLMAADLGGKSDPFAVFELDNAMLRTHNEYKTLV